ncbi:arylamine N-acetyltransferase family protein [Brevibacillus choshinensis]|uniref:arylamine N-acetyltransferase family protein n=1 Tax=Brevibacillus choshinensis TaxID=54911 RepID=UPI002E1CF7CE|nr:arylamine N-acetyltransferase [Brevibacillus choshinensis]MED4752351.1 arylamine N-acetyltransferase [Brevibacillus choshinensis]
MSELDTLFRKRIGMPEDETITFTTLGNVLEKTARAIPFENLCMIANETNEITRENLLNKILVKNEGGLCYELNSILYFFLLENGFQAALARGIVYKQATQEYQSIGRTHVTILLTHEGRTYLVDTGFGGNLPLKPVPLTGETVTSSNGEFRVKEVNSKHGDYVLEMKLKHKDTEWRIGYAIDSTKLISDVTELNEIQTVIGEHPDSPFNKNPLVTKLTESGNVTLTNSTFTKWDNGVVTKEGIDEVRYRELLKEWFGM